MLRQDAETDSPGFILTLTSAKPVTNSRAYSAACAAFWKWWRRNYGAVDYCGFMEWTTGKSASSGGVRRMHGHWLVKARSGRVPSNALISKKWRELHGSWKVELAALETIGGVVGYLALHHEKYEQRPPDGWTGRRFRPSKGYFAEPGHYRRGRARLYLAERREALNEFPRPYGELDRPRLVMGRSMRERDELELTAGPVASGYFDTLPARRALDRQLLRAAKAAASELELDYYERRYREMVTTRALRDRAARRLGRRSVGGLPDG